MAIEKRIIAGQEVGFNTETNSYCNLPKEAIREYPAASQPDDEKKSVGKSKKNDEDSGS